MGQRALSRAKVCNVQDYARLATETIKPCRRFGIRGETYTSIYDPWGGSRERTEPSDTKTAENYDLVFALRCRIP